MKCREFRKPTEYYYTNLLKVSDKARVWGFFMYNIGTAWDCAKRMELPIVVVDRCIADLLKENNVMVAHSEVDDATGNVIKWYSHPSWWEYHKKGGKS